MRRVLLVLIAAACRPAPPNVPAACLGDAVPDQGANHVTEPQPIDYVSNPPAGGPHWSCWAPWGSANRVVPPERWVHNLEHGGVVLLYRCADATSCPTARSALETVLAAAPAAPSGGKRILVTPDPTLPTAFAAVAWDFKLTMQTLDAAKVTCFVQAHEGFGPEDVAGNPSKSACPQSYE